MTDNKNIQHWRDLGVKDKAGLVTACSSFILGFVLAFIGMFISPIGVIDGSVLTAFGTSLVYAAGIFGFSMYIKHGSNILIRNIQDSVEGIIEKKFKEKEEHDNEADH